MKIMKHCTDIFNIICDSVCTQEYDHGKRFRLKKAVMASTRTDSRHRAHPIPSATLTDWNLAKGPFQESSRKSAVGSVSTQPGSSTDSPQQATAVSVHLV